MTPRLKTTLQIGIALGCFAIAGTRMTLRQPVFGGKATGARAQRIAASPNFRDGRAVNLTPRPMPLPDSSYVTTLGEYINPPGPKTPDVPLPLVEPDLARLGQDDGVRVTWLGHSTLLYEIDGYTILTDPMCSLRPSPAQWLGPKRFHDAPIAAQDLPYVDAIVISHDHYDHLDFETISAIAYRDVRFFTPLGVGAHLEAWGVPADHITELDWWESAHVRDFEIVATPSHHFSGRGPFDRARTQWASWALIGPEHRVWFSGDTGPFAEAAEIGERFGPFDLAALEVGAWNAAWGSIHLGPDAAMDMFRQVRGEVFMPIHWGTFDLATHAWDQPIVRVQRLAAEQDVALLTPVVGERVDPASPAVHPFWQERLRLATEAE